jgi:hypothetical protein
LEANLSRYISDPDWANIYKTLLYDAIETRLPQAAEICVASYTGSRMFGWGGAHYDIDVKGIFACKNWWGTVHIGTGGCDINMEELEHAVRRATGMWTFFEDLSNPFYIHPDFDYDTMMSFCTAQNVKNHLGTIKMQKDRLITFPEAVRVALHAYRLLMTPIYFLKTGKINVNTIEVNEEDYFGFPQLENLKQRYLYRKNVLVDWDEVDRNLDNLLVNLNRELYYRIDKYDPKKFEDWKEKTLTRFHGGPAWTE